VRFLRLPPRPVDVLNDAINVSAGQDEQSHGIDGLRVRRAWTAQEAARHSGDRIRRWPDALA